MPNVFLADFLEHLRQHGFVLGIDAYMRLENLLRQLPANCTTDELRDYLSPIFASNPKQQELFYQLFDQHQAAIYFFLTNEGIPLPPPSGNIPLSAQQVSTEPIELEPVRFSWFGYALIATIAALILLGGLFLVPCLRQNSLTCCLLGQCPAVPNICKQTLAFTHEIDINNKLAVHFRANLQNNDTASVINHNKNNKENNAKQDTLVSNIPKNDTGLDRSNLLRFKWDFGDQSPLDSTNLAPTHNYAKAGQYDVCLDAQFRDCGDTTTCQTIDLTNGLERPTLLLVPKESNLANTSPTSALAQWLFVIPLLLCAGLGLYGLYSERKRWVNRRLLLLKGVAAKPPFVRNLSIPNAIQVHRTDDTFLRLARQMRQRQLADLFMFDITQTIQKTIKAGGFFVPAYKRRQQPTEYLVLIDRRSYKDHQAHFFQSMVLLLRRQNVFIDYYFYDQDPRLCWHPPTNTDPGNALRFHNRGVYLHELSQRHATHRLVIMGDGHAMLHPRSGEIEEWVSSVMGAWKHRILLTPLNRWTVFEKRLSAFFVLQEATKQGFFNALQQIDLHQINQHLTKEFWMKKVKQNAFDPEDYDSPQETADALRSYLGDEQDYEWLCVCAVYPELYWDLTLTLLPQTTPTSLPEKVDTAISATTTGATTKPIVTDDANTIEQRRNKLFNLPYFRIGLMPDPLRLVFKAQLSEGKLKQVNEHIIKVLSEQLKLPNAAPAGSAVARDRLIELVCRQAENKTVDPSTIEQLKQNSQKDGTEVLWLEPDELPKDADLNLSVELPPYLRQELIDLSLLHNSWAKVSKAIGKKTISRWTKKIGGMAACLTLAALLFGYGRVKTPVAQDFKTNIQLNLYDEDKRSVAFGEVFPNGVDVKVGDEVDALIDENGLLKLTVPANYTNVEAGVSIENANYDVEPRKFVLGKQSVLSLHKSSEDNNPSRCGVLLAQADAAFDALTESSELEGLLESYQKALDICLNSNSGTYGEKGERGASTASKIRHINNRIDTIQQWLRDEYVKQGDAFWAKKSYDNALNAYEKALLYKPNDAYAQDKAAKTMAKIGQPPSNYEQVPATSTPPPSKIGNAKQQQQRYNNAMQRARQKITKTDFSGALKHLDTALQIKPQSGEAAELRKKAQEQVNQNVQFAALKQQAERAFSMGKYNDAKAKYEKALAIKPNDTYIKNQITQCQKYIDQSNIKVQKDALVRQADAAFKEGEYYKAKNLYESAMKLDNKNAYLNAQIQKCLEYINKEIPPAPASSKPTIDYPKKTTPEQTTPEQTTPEQTTPEQTTPEQTTPEQTTPEQTTPEQTTPEQTTPKNYSKKLPPK